MVQRIQLNKISLDKIQERFTDTFDQELTKYINLWTEWVKAGQTRGRSFYVSINSDYEVDGILLCDENNEIGTIFAKNQKAVSQLIHKVKKDVKLKDLVGDACSVDWAQKII